MFETAVVNEPPVFELLMFFCILIFLGPESSVLAVGAGGSC